ncbi:NLI interacting factor [Cinnamomum micranthum f. kanehirae]|uniref:Mitochondrial import inner membrane translocase subunit TIM50 n=1 Tax=Cinnamomum micranthum f. kanehirae TaxID=337451 RepID=A0A443NXK6_9MAGN|nr:NLI interacting factor [Cinnamomum micranthum f. kanehirae]
MGAECSLPCFKSPKHVVEEHLNKSQDKCNIHDNKESAAAESSINLNLVTSLETESTTEVGTVENAQIQNKLSAPKSHDTTLKPLEEGSVCNPDQTNIESLEQDKINSSLQTIGSPVGRASASSLNKVYLSKKMKKRKEEWTVLKDNVCKALCAFDHLHEGAVKKNVDELTLGQIELVKCNASEEVKSMEVLLTDPGNPFMDISIPGCGDEELASTRKTMKKEVKSTIYEAGLVDDSTMYDHLPDYLLQNGEVLSNLQRVVPDRRIIVEMNLESCSNDCLNEAKNNIENGGNKQDNLLEASMSPEIIPVNSTRRKLLILDVNGLLVDIVEFQPNWRRPDKKVSRRSVYKRPFCDDFIKFCFDRFDVGIWSSRTSKNLEAVLKIFIGDDKNKLLFCWDQSHCTSTGFKTIENRNKPLFLKELKKIWDKEEPNLPWEKGEYTPSNTLLLDDSPYKALRNPPYTAIFPSPYNFQDENDNSLGPEGDLRVYLEGLARSDDVRCYVQKHPFGQHAITSADPSWPFYLKVIGVENSSAPALCHQRC